MNIVTPDISCIDLFCGLGGLTHGFIKSGINVVAGIDIDPQCRFAYEVNNKIRFIEQDINAISGKDITAIFGSSKLRLLAGCAPCQPFSAYSQKGRGKRNDSKWTLVSEFGRLIEESEPEFVTMENVPQLLTHDVFQDFLKKLDGYQIWWDIVDCAQYGVPQTRKRLVLLASRLGPINLLPPDQNKWLYKTVRQAISHLPILRAGSISEEDQLHAAPSLTELNLKRIQSSKPGGTWRDWDSALVAECHRKTSGQTYPSVYGRMEWDKQSPTITTQCFGFGNGRFGHPEQDRAISLREAAILQTFPEDYQFLAPGERVSFNKMGRLIGNAVPVRIGEVIAQSFLNHISKIQALPYTVISECCSTLA